jgi:probable phosphoglycerate mutase
LTVAPDKKSLLGALVSDGHVVVVAARHGRTAWNALGRFLGRSDVPLDEVGRSQARELASRWAVDEVVSSPLRRALATAQAFGRNVRVDPDLVELAHGALEGMATEEGIARFPQVFRDWGVDPGPVRLPGGETLAEGRDRLLRALSRLEGRPRVVALVSHQLVLGAALATLAAEPLASWRRFGLGPGQDRVLAWKGAWKLVHWPS